MAPSAAAFAEDFFELPTAEDVASEVVWMTVGGRREGKPPRRARQDHSSLALSEDPGAAVVLYDFGDEPSSRGTIEAEGPRWLAPTVFALSRILDLPAGWDSYGAPRIQASAVNTALELLASSAQEDSPTPIVVPTTAGGVQLEWHAWGVDVELDVSPGETPLLFFRDRVSDQTQEEQLTTNLAPLSQALRVLTERAAQEAGR